MRPVSHRVQVALGIAATLILTGLSVVAVGALSGGVNPGGYGFPSGSSCTVPNLSGTVVNVTLRNMGGPMMGGPAPAQRNGMMYGGAMRLSADRATVPHGSVSFLVTNSGSTSHEMVILPLPDSQIVGTRPIGGDAEIDEVGSFGEASATCGDGTGQGILPGASSWVTITLVPGRYELVCNLPGHYAAGMYGQLTVT
jgi:uncharacterized cupredoxin-like copper-binding protein